MYGIIQVIIQTLEVSTITPFSKWDHEEATFSQILQLRNERTDIPGKTGGLRGQNT